MALPRDRFEVAWTATPWDADPYWVDATPWLLGIGRERGRQPRDPVNRATKCRARLDNRDGRFTMQNGPTTPNLIPEAGQTGWIVNSSCTIVLHGGWLRATCTLAGSMGVLSPSVTGIVPGTSYTFRALPVAVTAARAATVTAKWYTSGGAFISQTAGTAVVEAPGVAVTVISTAPATAAQCKVGVDWVSGVAVGETHDLTLVAMAAGATVLPPYWPNVEPRRPCRWVTDGPTNLIPEPNATFPTGTAGAWLATTNAVLYPAVGSLTNIPPAAGQSDMQLLVGGLTAGGTYTFAGVLSSNVSRTATLTVFWVDSGGLTISSQVVGVFPLTPSPVQKVGSEVVAPAGTTQAYLRVGFVAAGANTDNVGLQAMRFTGVSPHPRFEGLLESLPTAWTDFADEEATFTASGRLAGLADIDLPGSVWERTVKSTAPVNWWQFDEPETATRFYDSGSGSSPAVLTSGYDGDGAAPKTTGAPMLPSGARRFEPGSFGLSPTSVTAGTADWTVSVVARIDMRRPAFPPLGTQRNTTTGLVYAHQIGTSAFVYTLRLAHEHFVYTTGELHSRLFVEVNSTFVAQLIVVNFGTIAIPSLLRDDWFVVTMRRASNVVTLFLDGQPVAAGSSTYSFASSDMSVGPVPASDVTQPTPIDEAVTWTRALSDTEVANVADAVQRPYAGDTVAQRWDRFRTTSFFGVLDTNALLPGVPPARMPVVSGFADAGQHLGRTRLGGKALTYLHRLARASRGRLVDTPTGTIELRTGGDLLNRRTSQATFGQQAGDLPYAHVSTDPSFARIVTSARAKIVEGSVRETVATDLIPGSSVSYVDRYGRRGPTEGEIGDLLLSTDQEAKDYTSWLVNAGKRPDVALDPLVLHPLGDTAVTTAVLSLDIDDVVTVRKKHPRQANTITTVCRIAGINETVSRTNRGQSWVCEWRLEPLDPTPYILADGTYLADGTQIAY